MTDEVMPTEAAVRKYDTKRAKYHWANDHGRSRCGGIPLAPDFAREARHVKLHQKCRANGCRQAWIAREPDPGPYGAGPGFN